MIWSSLDSMSLHKFVVDWCDLLTNILHGCFIDNGMGSVSEVTLKDMVWLHVIKAQENPSKC